MEGLAELDVKGGMEIKEYISEEEELAPETCTINWTKIRKVIKALRVI